MVGVGESIFVADTYNHRIRVVNSESSVYSFTVILCVFLSVCMYVVF